jgi:hypothetical protein
LKNEAAFVEMADMVEMHLGQLDGAPRLDQISDLLVNSSGDAASNVTVGGLPQCHIRKRDVAAKLSRLNLTFGKVQEFSAGRSSEGDEVVTAMAAMGFAETMNSADVEGGGGITDDDGGGGGVRRAASAGAAVGTRTATAPSSGSVATGGERRNSALFHVCSAAAAKWAFKPEDSTASKIRKLDSLENTFFEDVGDIGALFRNIDLNGSGEVSTQEWFQFVTDRYVSMAELQPVHVSASGKVAKWQRASHKLIVVTARKKHLARNVISRQHSKSKKLRRQLRPT